MGKENLPNQGPAVFIANHLDATGPIAVCGSIPLRFYSWTIANMMDKDLAPEYLREDFIEHQLHFKPPVSLWISNVLSKITVPLFFYLGFIPVYRGDYRKLRRTMEISISVLCEDNFILVFPEDPRLPANPETKMCPFQHSFARLGEMYYSETAECLEFYPLTVHPSRKLVVGKPIRFNPLNPVAVERQRLKDLLEDTIATVYLRLEEENLSNALTAEFK